MPRSQLHKRNDCLALQRIGNADGRSLGNRWMRDQRALNLGCADAMSSDIEHIVRSTYDADVAVLIFRCEVARYVATRQLLPIFLEARGIIPDRPHELRERPLQDQASANAGSDRLAVDVHNVGFAAR